MLFFLLSFIRSFKNLITMLKGGGGGGGGGGVSVGVGDGTLAQLFRRAHYYYHHHLIRI